jgi:hypothetical protein
MTTTKTRVRRPFTTARLEADLANAQSEWFANSCRVLLAIAPKDRERVYMEAARIEVWHPSGARDGNSYDWRLRQAAEALGVTVNN